VAGVPAVSEVPTGLISVLAVVLIASWILQAAVLVIFIPFLRSPWIETRERALGAVRDAFVSGVIALLSADYLWGLHLGGWLLFSLLAIAYLTFPARSVIFLWLWYRRRFA
jgi:hypothetical protein